MNPRSSATALADAWWLMPPAAPAAVSVGAFTAKRMNRTINLLAGLACLALGAQGFFAALGGTGLLPMWNESLMIVTFVPLLVMCVAALLNRLVVPTAGLFTLVYLVVLVVWPFVAADQPATVAPEPWIWFLINVATAAAVLAFELSTQIIWTVGIPVVYGFARLVTGEFAPEFWVAVAFEVPFAIILGGVVLVLVLVFRRASVNVDDARARAVATYASAAEAQAMAEERVEIASLMHDSVLAALSAAERAESPRERALAASMAREALAGLASAESGDESEELEPMTPQDLAIALRDIAKDGGARVPVTYAEPVRGKPVPGQVARQLLLAAAQAIANGVQHADSVGLTAHIEPIPGDGVVIVVSDRGPGFDPEKVPPGRLGVRASIFARVTAVGGLVDIASQTAESVVDRAAVGAPGSPKPAGTNIATNTGTTVTITWNGDAAW